MGGDFFFFVSLSIFLSTLVAQSKCLINVSPFLVVFYYNQALRYDLMRQSWFYWIVIPWCIWENKAKENWVYKVIRDHFWEIVIVTDPCPDSVYSKNWSLFHRDGLSSPGGWRGVICSSPRADWDRSRHFWPKPIQSEERQRIGTIE